MFTKKDAVVLQKIAAAILPDQKEIGSSIHSIDFEASLNQFSKYCAPSFILFIRFGLMLISLFVRIRFLTSLAALETKQLAKFINRWSSSRSFLKYLLLRPILVLIYTTYYSDPSVSQKLGYMERKVSTDIYDHDFKESFLIVQDKLITTEICIIGSGAGGAVAAKELAEKGHEVLILEEGDYFSRRYFNSTSTLERNQSIYRDAGFVTTLGFPLILLPTGKSIGGTTIINSGTCFRTPKAILEQWHSDFGLKNCTYEQMTPFFDKVENYLKVSPVTQETLGGNNLKIALGTTKLGYQGFPLDRNAHKCQGTGVCIFGCPTGAKQSMERNYLPLAVQAGAKILRNTKAIKFNSINNHVDELYCEYKNEKGVKEKLIIKAKKFIVACGTLESPLLLQRSGLGRQSGQLGRNLSIHPTAKMMGLFPDELAGDFGVPQGYGIRDFESKGMMFESVFFPPWLLATSIFQCGESHWNIMKNYKKIGIFGFLVHDDSRGVVKQGPDGRPLIFYSLGKKEKQLFVEGLKILGRLFFAAGATKVYPTLRTKHEINELNELEQLSVSSVRRRDIESAAFHPLGTCRMGGDPMKSVVDENLMVHGMKNLWVIDGSVLPTSLGVNPQVTIMAFATKAAEHVHQA